MRWLIILQLLAGSMALSGCAGCESGEDLPAKRTSSTGSVPESGVRPTILHTEGGPTVVRMKKQDGVWKIPVTINGVSMDFIFDTGAGLITISNLEASILFKQGRI